MTPQRIVLWIVLVSGAAGMALHTSLRVRAQEDALTNINRQIASEEERIHVLTAEWNMLKSPARVEELTRRHLEDLGRVKPVQIASLDDIPDRLPPAAPEDATATPENSALPVAQDAVPAPSDKPPVRLAKIEPAPKPEPVRVASVEPRQADPLADVISRTTNSTQDEDSDNRATFLAAGLKDRSAHTFTSTSRTPSPRDEIRELIERQPTAPGVIMASAGGAR